MPFAALSKKLSVAKPQLFISGRRFDWSCFRGLARAHLLLVLLLMYGTVFAGEDLGVRLLKQVDSKSEIDLAAFTDRSAPLSRFGNPRPELALGLLQENDVSRVFVSYGLVWQLQRDTRLGVFLGEFTFAPTLLGGAKFETKDLGGVFHFTSGLALRWKPEPRSSLSIGLRLQHVSNGGLGSTNPGLDSFGLELIWVPQL